VRWRRGRCNILRKKERATEKEEGPTEEEIGAMKGQDGTTED
jgi:hypothetical protein